MARTEKGDEFDADSIASESLQCVEHASTHRHIQESRSIGVFQGVL